MSKFCFECGTRLDDGAAFCTSCGAPQEATIPVIPVAEPAAKTMEEPQVAQPVYAQPAEPVPVAPPAPPVRRAKKSRKGLKVFLVLVGLMAMFLAGLVVGAVAGAVVMHLVNNNVISDVQNKPPVVTSQYTDPIDDYIDILVNGNYETIRDMAPEIYWENTEPYETYDPITQQYISVEDEYKYRQEFAKYWHEWAKDRYGDDLKVRYEITQEEEISLTRLTLIAQCLQEYYKIDTATVEEGRTLKLEFQINGSQDVYAGEVEGTVVKIDGTWYWVEVIGISSNNVIAYFPVFYMLA